MTWSVLEGICKLASSARSTSSEASRCTAAPTSRGRWRQRPISQATDTCASLCLSLPLSLSLSIAGLLCTHHIAESLPPCRIGQGATSLWENWQGTRYQPGGQVSQSGSSWNHIMYGSQGSFYYEHVARPALLGSLEITKAPPRLECDVLRVKPSAQTHTDAPHCGSHCHQLRVF